MAHTAERIEMVRLLQKLKHGDEKPGATTLRAMKLAERMSDGEAMALAGLNALKAAYPNDLAFANTGFTLGVVQTIITSVIEGLMIWNQKS
jgi:hypothetical protein